MPNLATTLKEEIRRLARREIKAQISTTKRATVRYRSEIARLKRQLQLQEKKIASLEHSQRKGPAPPEAAEEPAQKTRFSARSVRAQRKRLRLSAAEFGKLVGVSGQTIYAWEQGQARPRKAQFAALIAARGLGRREALSRLKAL